MKTLIQMVIVSISLSVCLNIYSADNISKVTYKWVDEQGITQYTERPPKSMAYEKITVNISGGSESEQVTAAEAKAQTSSTPLDEVAQSNQRNCVVVKQNMEVLVKLARIRVSDEKGENRILSPEEKQARIDETQKQIDIYCKGTDSN